MRRILLAATALVGLAGAACADVLPPLSAVLAIDPTATTHNAPLEIVGRDGQRTLLGTIDPTNHTFAPANAVPQVNGVASLLGISEVGAGVPGIYDLIGQGAKTSVSNYFKPTAVGGRHYVLGAEMDVGNAPVGDKVAVYGDCQTGTQVGTDGFASGCWGANFLVQWRKGDPDAVIQDIESDFNNMNYDYPHIGAGLKTAYTAYSGGQYHPGYAMFVTATNPQTDGTGNGWRQGILMYPGAVTDTGVNVGTPGLYGTYVGYQLKNGGDSILMERNTDVGPAGQFLRLTNAANSANIFQVDVSGNLVTSGIGVFGPAPGVDQVYAGSALSSTALGGFNGMGVENGSSVNSTNKTAQFDFVGRDTANTQKQIAYVADSPEDANLLNSGLAFGTRQDDALAMHFRISSSGHFGSVGSTPTLSGCGASPTITGNDASGEIIEGSGATGCTLNFAKIYLAQTFCTMSSQTGAPFSYAVQTIGLSILNNGSAGAGTKFNYTCNGY